MQTEGTPPWTSEIRWEKHRACVADLDAVRAELGRRWPEAPNPMQARLEEGPHALDRFLAASAVRHERWAVQALEHEVFAPIRFQLARRHDASAVDEALQELRTELVAAGGLAAFAGRGPLKAWMLVSAVRRLYAKSGPNQLTDELPAIASAPATAELALIRARYGPLFKGALERAFAALTRRQRVLLSMTVEQKLSAQQIGRIFHVHRATATEWIAEARSALRDSVKANLQRETGMTDSEFDSVGHALQEQTDLSLPRLLAQRDGA